jgi:hypothetical protein
MDVSDVQDILRQIEEQLASVENLDPVAEQAIQTLLNLIERLVAAQRDLLQQVQRLKEQLENKKKKKTTAADNGDEKPKQNHSSEKHRKKLQPPPAPRADRRSFKEVPVHQETECPLDPAQLPPDARRIDDEFFIVRDIKIEPFNTRYRRHVYFSPSQNKVYRGSLPEGVGPGEFGADLRSLIISLKYSAGTSEPKIRELLENFQVQISSGSISNILTGSEAFQEDFDDLVLAGLSSTSYQQTDDTSARVAGEFWHTHILCNPYYTAYFTRARKDRLTILEVLQNTTSLCFQFNAETGLRLAEADIPQKWQDRVAALGEVQYDAAGLKELLDEWFGKDRGTQTRTTIEQAAAVVYYRHQTAVPLVQTLVCDDARQFKSITDFLALCWVHAGRHYHKLRPVVTRHQVMLDEFITAYWDYYAKLQRYRADPTTDEASGLRLEFDELFSTVSGYEALNERIAKTRSKKDELLTVLDHPEVPLHNNDSELGARVSARRRDVSLHSRSKHGARSMDIFTTLVQTCKKLGVSAYSYIRDRLSGRRALPSLSELIRTAAASI